MKIYLGGVAIAVDISGESAPVSLRFAGPPEGRGWFQVARRFARLAPGGAEGYSIRQACADDYRFMRGAHSLFASGLNGPVARESLEYWETRAIPQMQNPSIIERGCERAAYIDFEGARVREYACHPDYPLALRAAAALLGRELICPAPIAPDGAIDTAPDSIAFARLNAPFFAGREEIASTEALARLFSNAAFFEPDL